MPVSNGDLFRVAIRWRGPDGQDFVNVWHCEAILTADMDDEDFGYQVGVWLNDPLTINLATHIRNQYLLYDWKVDEVEFSAGKINIVRSLGTFAYASGTPQGLNVNENLPAGCAPVVKFRTSGVKTLARKFMFGITENSGQNGVLNATVLGALGAYAATYLDPIELQGFPGQFVRAVVHSKRANAWLPFLSIAVNSIFGYQRRRKQGTGS